MLSVDGENEPDMLGMIATSAALSISPIPWNGPIGAVRVGFVPPPNGKHGFFVNPGVNQMKFSDMDLIVSATKDKVVMLEAGANEIKEETATVTHEASVGKISEEHLFYLMSRGLTEQEAMTMVVMGFFQGFVKELPLDYAVELNKLIQLEMEGAIG